MSMIVPEMHVSRETKERLEAFVALLEKWNPRINLVSSRDMAFVWDRHVRDSLQIAPLVQGASSFIDLGSGGGFPGVITAIATNVPGTLIESDQRKAAFLREAARVTVAPVKVLAERIEQATPEPAPIVTARALAALPKLLEWTAPLLAKGGKAVFLKGQQAEDELTEARRNWHMDVCIHPSVTSHDGVILEVSNLERV
ncbi:16S rRNA (guanine(527)-N(7))-methyltransferase RsmG [Acetobacter tropicalis]|uniref:Ribosomal RNA small subunit methyltransferase G n=2 Tax=Acetobacter TaxID=434 RepID=A0A0U5ETG4_9PROT|nr:MULTISPECIES: 16S rRNA (guanine(527)-N(7))-methyltransferase RsmG [Acetobacter]MCG4253826.1 16S rRNA (guanine(527)-N(7))-methyltransferase RsmG [Acetobacter senegalensis]MCG4257880.1 16S rRNA (guanine(527)-N(7))-methyltransferase RsmG [Acetobacter senegalensis]MCG4260017.1 16S rRNA (guanine(527)-N(7))-methyltransferase RsmG [Acetobacter senegalensis]MCG4267807.1 16S rRNA (guanine(527)-N(7))-methyltransferase RsmG [Acetobacter senegalensis]MCP1196701.1 16S rRNA (guanine(527)-N(7))-methyltran